MTRVHAEVVRNTSTAAAGDLVLKYYRSQEKEYYNKLVLSN